MLFKTSDDFLAESNDLEQGMCKYHAPNND